jgi:hypothetical protein
LKMKLQSGTSRHSKRNHNWEKAVILGQTGVTKSVEGGKSYFEPIEESREVKATCQY